ncbi:MAG TPA: hypothetical protein VLS89_07610 [Candidatus Nanopelagicales bacterium]|nr:hypothetical protein [Candidatus Nanopelagicales bacterium]
MVTLGEWASSSAEVRDLPVDSVEQRTRFALQTLRILPRGDVDTVGIGGRLVGRARPVVFRAEHERRLVDVIRESTTPQPFDNRDEIRAIDLDRGRILLGKKSRTLCYVRPEQLPQVVTVGVPAHVTGKLFSPIVGRPFVLVDSIEVGSQPDDEA